MAPDGRAPDQSLMQRLQEAPYRFDFFQLVRQLECLHRDKPRIGRSLKPDQDPIRFGQAPTLAFAPASVAGYKETSSGRVPKLDVYFLGLVGPNGPMPLHITQYIRDRLHNYHDPTLASFLDVFHHRAISLFYRAWADCQPTVNRDRPDDDRMAFYMNCLIGLGFDALTDRDHVPDDAKRYFTGRLAHQTHNAEGLESILSDYFGVPARLKQFIGHWVQLPEAYRCKLGKSPLTGTLGRSSLVGERYWDVRQKFRIVLGPLSLDDYTRFLPSGRSFPALRDWVRNYIGLHLKWDVQLILKHRQIPSLDLGKGARLGWTTWTAARGFDEPADDLILQPPEY